MERPAPGWRTTRTIFSAEKEGPKKPVWLFLAFLSDKAGGIKFSQKAKSKVPLVTASLSSKGRGMPRPALSVTAAGNVRKPA